MNKQDQHSFIRAALAHDRIRKLIVITGFAGLSVLALVMMIV